MDGKDAVSFCDSQCQQWIHRYCAGVSKTQLKLLSSSAEVKYECATCFQESHRKDTIVAIQVNRPGCCWRVPILAVASKKRSPLFLIGLISSRS